MAHVGGVDGSREEALRLVVAAAAEGDPRLGWLSQAYEAVVLSRSGVSADSAVRIEAITDALRRIGWLRAVALAESALSMAMFATPERRPAAIAMLLAHGKAAQDTRPPAERIWTDAMAAIHLCAAGRYDEALTAALSADRLAGGLDISALEVMGTRALSFIFLSVGDIEGALGVLPRELAAARRAGMARLSANYNLMLALLLDQQYDRILAMVDEDPWLAAPEQVSSHPSMACLVACALAMQGRKEEALARLPQASASQSLLQEPQMAANRVWMEAWVHVEVGQPERARRDIEEFLGQAAAANTLISPMNGTQLLRVLGEACEASGDLRGALAALKASQKHCFTWVSESVRLRLQVLRADSTETEGVQRHQLRLHTIGAAATAATLDPIETAQRQRHFLSQVVHEMRNPLNGVVGMTSLLMLSELDERQRQYVQLAQTSAQMLMHLCSDVLDLAKIEAGRFTLNSRPTDIARLVDETVQMLSPMAELKGLTARATLDSSLPELLMCDALRLQQVLMNLLSNAIKFTQRGTIDLRATWRPHETIPGQGELLVNVVDTGPGLDAQARTRLFQEFVQIDTGETEVIRGTGLGLALCRSLLQLMNGQIGVDSEPGRGSTFWFRLPLAAAAVEVGA
jgi:signal transduction histidine kinase